MKDYRKNPDYKDEVIDELTDTLNTMQNALLNMADNLTEIKKRYKEGVLE